MANISHHNTHSNEWLRWLARGVGSVLAALWLFIGLSSAILGDEPWTPESYFMVGFMAGGVILPIIAWRWEKVGGILLIIFGLIFSTFAYFSAGHNQWFAVLISGIPFLITGILFLTSRRVNNTNQ
ncbi:MAG: hypothetical protein HF973_14445 [Chloroflexi bacterium]|nr:hypothetical protein [Chloroflexota bacterium]